MMISAANTSAAPTALLTVTRSLKKTALMTVDSRMMEP